MRNVNFLQLSQPEHDALERKPNPKKLGKLQSTLQNGFQESHAPWHTPRHTSREVCHETQAKCVKPHCYGLPAQYRTTTEYNRQTVQVPKAKHTVQAPKTYSCRAL